MHLDFVDDLYLVFSPPGLVLITGSEPSYPVYDPRVRVLRDLEDGELVARLAKLWKISRRHNLLLIAWSKRLTEEAQTVADVVVELENGGAGFRVLKG